MLTHAETRVAAAVVRVADRVIELDRRLEIVERQPGRV
jgi:hypothetical protein